MTSRETAPRRRPRPRRSFTLVELIVAGAITAFVFTAISASLANLARARHSSRQRLEAYLRADAALEMMRRDVVSIIRHDDLFFTRFLLMDGTFDTRSGRLNRDELLVFAHRLRQSRSIEFNGEGTEYEVQYRIVEQDDAPVLWQRRDSFPDPYPRGGGVATPVVDGIVALNVEAYDGFQWRTDWDSDFDGMPHAVRLTVTASGEADEEDVYDAPLATLRTVVSIDRILLPRENLIALYEAEHGSAEDEEMQDGGDLVDDIMPGLDPSGPLPAGARIGPDGQIIVPGGDFTVIDPSTIQRQVDPREGRRGNRGDVRMPPTPGTGPSTSSTGGPRGGSGGGSQ